MATDTNTGTLYELASEMLSSLNEKPEAAELLGAYDMRVQFTVTDGSPFYAVLRDGKLQSVEEGQAEGYSNREDFEVFGSEEGLRLVFEKRMSPATAMYYGKMTPRGERAKHCQVAVTYTLLRIAQDESKDMISTL
jgi:hypothetical protein